MAMYFGAFVIGLSVILRLANPGGMDSPGITIALGILITIFMSFFLRSALSGFLIGSIALATLCIKDPFFEIGQQLYANSTTPSMFIIILFCGALSLLERRDLDELDDKLKPPFQLIDLLAKLRRKHRTGASLLMLLATFPASTVAGRVLKPQSDQKLSLACFSALCLCVLGPMIIPVSSWGLFFGETIEAYFTNLYSTEPQEATQTEQSHNNGIQLGYGSFGLLGSGIYMLLMFGLGVRSYSKSLAKASAKSDNNSKEQFSKVKIENKNPNSRLNQYFNLYHVGIFLLFTVSIVLFMGTSSVDTGEEAIPYRIMSSLAFFTIGLITLQRFLAPRYQKPAGKRKIKPTTWTSLFGYTMNGHLDGVRTVIFIAAVVTFKNLLQLQLDGVSTPGYLDFLSSQPVISAIAIFTTVTILGILIGSAFGTFAFTLIFANFVGSDFEFWWHFWIIQGGIILAGFANQWSHAADNWSVIGGEFNWKSKGLLDSLIPIIATGEDVRSYFNVACLFTVFSIIASGILCYLMLA